MIKNIKRFQIFQDGYYKEHVTFIELNGNLTIYARHRKVQPEFSIFSSKMYTMSIDSNYGRVRIVYRNTIFSRYQLKSYRGFDMHYIPQWLNKYMIKGPKKIIARIDDNTYGFDVDNYC
jgi:hypothetical protein